MPDVGIVFLEHSHLSNAARERARRYRALFAGSEWNAEVLRGSGVGPVMVGNRASTSGGFTPRPVKLFPDRFLVFSGGALQIRKAQDIVLAAFRIFRRCYREALLITAWGSPYVQYARSILLSKLIAVSPFVDPELKQLDLDPWLRKAGIPERIPSSTYRSSPILRFRRCCVKRMWVVSKPGRRRHEPCRH